MRQFPFAVLILATIAVDFATFLPLGALPLALAKGGAPVDQIALAMGGGMFATLIASIPVGALIDRIGRIIVLRLSIVLLVFSMVGLALTHGVLAAGLLLALRGLAAMAFYTAGYAYVSEIVSPERSISSISQLGNAGNIAVAVAPAFSVWLWQHGIGDVQFFYAGIVCVIGFALLFLLPKVHDIQVVRRSRMIIMRSLWLPTMGFNVVVSLPGGVNGSLAVLTFTDRGIANGALLFTALAVAMFVFRFPAGRLVDRWGPLIMTIPTLIAQIIGCILAAYAYTPLQVLLAGAFLGIAGAAYVPVSVGFIFKQSSRQTRGVAIGASSFARYLGGAVGTILAWFVVRVGSDYSFASELCAISALLVMPWLLLSYGRPRKA